MIECIEYQKKNTQKGINLISKNEKKLETA